MAMNRKMTLSVMLAAVVASAVAPTYAHAQEGQPDYLDEYIQLAREGLREDKSRVVGEAMQLDAEQAAKFWPIYESYEKEIAEMGDDRITILKDYAKNLDTMDHETADALIKRSFDILTRRIEIWRKYYDRVAAELSPMAAARFIQVENFLMLTVNLRIAAEVPIVPRR